MTPTRGGLPALIKKARKARRWSQEELGARTQSSRDTIWRFEKGGSIESERVERILDVLGLLDRLQDLDVHAEDRPRDPLINAWRRAYGESAEMRGVLESIARPYLVDERPGAASEPEQIAGHRPGAGGSTSKTRGRTTRARRGRDDERT